MRSRVNSSLNKIVLYYCITSPLCAGLYCASYGLTVPTAPCSGGYFCPPGQNSSSPAQFTCTPGHHCPEGSAEEVACESGTYQDLFGQVLLHEHHNNKKFAVTEFESDVISNAKRSVQDKHETQKNPVSLYR